MYMVVKKGSVVGFTYGAGVERFQIYNIYNADRYICDEEMRESEGYLNTPRRWPKMRINRYDVVPSHTFFL